MKNLPFYGKRLADFDGCFLGAFCCFHFLSILEILTQLPRNPFHFLKKSWLQTHLLKSGFQYKSSCGRSPDRVTSGRGQETGHNRFLA
jgi:hypothetical protein